MTDLNEPLPTRDKWLKDGLCALGLMVATVMFYAPALRGGFLWDDDTHISANWTLQSLKGLWAIWFRPSATCQYYPLSFTGFWAGYHLWGLNPAGYHLLNVLLHSSAAILLWQVLARLRVPGALLAGALFALHPVNVMSVAWMTELKNTLSGSLALGAAWAYVRFAGLGVYEQNSSGAESRMKIRWGWYALSLFLFQLAMFAKTAVSFLPLTLFFILVWQRKRVGLRDVITLIPMVAIAVAMGALTIYIEKHSGGATGEDFRLTLAQRLLVSGHSFWFYLGKLFIPIQLTFIYPRWEVNASDWEQYLYPAATFALLTGLWVLRHWIGKGIWAALMHFYVSTSMLVLGLVLFMMRYSFVSDHWQYYGSMGVIGLSAAGIFTGLERLGIRSPRTRTMLLAPLLLFYSVLTWRQCGMYKDSETLWRTTIAHNPGSWMAHDNLGNALSLTGQTQEAISEHQEALKLHPNSAETYSDLANALLSEGRTGEAISNYRKSLKINPNNPSSHYNLGNVLLHQSGDLDEAVLHLQKSIDLEIAMGFWPGNGYAHYDLGVALGRKGRFLESVAHYRIALEIFPQLVPAQTGLAWTLATCPLDSVRNGSEAVALALKSNQLTGDRDPAVLQTLAAAYAEVGQFTEATQMAQRALAISINQSSVSLTESLQQQIALYEANHPFRDEDQRGSLGR